MSLHRKSLKKHLKSIKENRTSTNKSFWKFIKPFLTNKVFIGSNDITFVESNVVTTDEMTIGSTFNKHYINIVEKSSGKPPKHFSKMSHSISKQKVPCDILIAYKNHPSIKQIEKKFNGQNFFGKEKFLFKPVVPPETTPLLTVAINKSTEENIFPDLAKIASVIPLDKGKPNKNEISNYRSVSVLNTFSKFYESH